MKVLLINGSPKINGNTARALEEMVTVFEKESKQKSSMWETKGFVVA